MNPIGKRNFDELMTARFLYAFRPRQFFKGRRIRWFYWSVRIFLCCHRLICYYVYFYNNPILMEHGDYIEKKKIRPISRIRNFRFFDRSLRQHLSFFYDKDYIHYHVLSIYYHKNFYFINSNNYYKLFLKKNNVFYFEDEDFLSKSLFLSDFLFKDYIEISQFCGFREGPSLSRGGLIKMYSSFMDWWYYWRLIFFRGHRKHLFWLCLLDLRVYGVCYSYGSFSTVYQDFVSWYSLYDSEASQMTIYLKSAIIKQTIKYWAELKIAFIFLASYNLFLHDNGWCEGDSKRLYNSFRSVFLTYKINFYGYEIIQKKFWWNIKPFPNSYAYEFYGPFAHTHNW